MRLNGGESLSKFLMTTVEDVLMVARAEIGYREGRNNSTKFGQWYGVDRVPWCAIFVSYCFFRAELILPATNDKGFAYCPYGVNWFRKQNRFDDRNPCVGDVVFFDWNKDRIADHIGIIESVRGNEFTSIEGNTSIRNDSNGGQVMRRRRFISQCQGFGKPTYNDESSLKLDKYYGVPIRLSNPFMRGIDVSGFQEQLKSLGYGIKVDGIYGNKSVVVCKQFQGDNDLITDGIVGKNTWGKAFGLKKPLRTELKKPPQIDFDEHDVDVLARTIYGEARGELREGRFAVAFSVLNRLKAGSWYGDTAKEVCQKPWQYSVWNKNDPNLEVIQSVDESDPLFKESLKIARKVLRQEAWDFTHGSTHYYAKSLENVPDWAKGKKPAATIGNHLFFNNVN